MRSSLRLVLSIVLPFAASACSGLPYSEWRQAQPVTQLVVTDENAPTEVPEDAQKRFERALYALEEQRWDVASEDMRELWSDYPELSGPALNSALIYSQQGEADEAELWFKRAVESNSGNAVAHNEYAIFLRQQGRFHESKKHYLLALELSGDYAEAHYNLGILYDLYLGDKGRALDHFKRYQQITGETDRQVAGWIVDLQRQRSAYMRGEGAET